MPRRAPRSPVTRKECGRSRAPLRSCRSATTSTRASCSGSCPGSARSAQETPPAGHCWKRQWPSAKATTTRSASSGRRPLQRSWVTSGAEVRWRSGRQLWRGSAARWHSSRMPSPHALPTCLLKTGTRKRRRTPRKQSASAVKSARRISQDCRLACLPWWRPFVDVRRRHSSWPTKSVGLPVSGASRFHQHSPCGPWRTSTSLTAIGLLRWKGTTPCPRCDPALDIPLRRS